MPAKYKPLSQLVENFRGRKLYYTNRQLKSRVSSKAFPMVQQQFEDSVEHEPDDIDVSAIRSEIYYEWTSRGHLKNLHIRMLRKGVWILFIKVGSSDPLAEGISFSKDYIDAIRQKRRPSIVGALLHAFIKHYPVEFPTFDLWRNSIHSLVETTRGRSLNQWRVRLSNYDHMSSSGVKDMVHNILGEDGKIEPFLEKTGLIGELAISRYVEMCCRYAWDWTKEYLHHNHIKVQRLNSIIQLSTIKNDKLRFPELKNEIAKSLLLPFASRNPEPNIEKLITDFLIDKIGDPRINRFSWNGIDTKATSILKSWLVKLTLKDFFNLIDDTAYEHHWMYRKPFWWSYYKRGYITDAWVALGRQPAQQAEEGQLNEYAEYGKIKSGGLPDHSVLLMKIGTAIIVERSHTGKCRIWLQNRRKRPVLHQKEYNNYSLMQGASEEFVHSGSENGVWQWNIATYLYRQLGIEPPKEDIFP